MKLHNSTECSSVFCDLNNVDEFTGYANGDGTCTLEIHTWVTDKEGIKKPATFTIPHAIINDIEMLYSGDPMTPMYKIVVKE